MAGAGRLWPLEFPALPLSLALGPGRQRLPSSAPAALPSPRSRLNHTWPGKGLCRSPHCRCRPGPRSSGRSCLALPVHPSPQGPASLLDTVLQHPGPSCLHTGPRHPSLRRPFFPLLLFLPFRPVIWTGLSTPRPQTLESRAPGRLGIPMQTDIGRPSCASRECQKLGLWTRRDRTSCDLGQIKWGLK